MLTIAGVNFVVDPGEIYLKKILADIKAKEFSDKLFLSERGVIQSGWNERLVKTTLAKSAGNFDCIVMGSSHVMQISEVRNTGNIKDNCNTLLNLGVSGGSLEDLSVFSYLVLNNLNVPRKVFLAVDPWTLKFGQDARYGAYKSFYEKMNELLGKVAIDKDTSYVGKIVKNLFNGEYFYYSILYLSDSRNKKDSDSPLLKAVHYPDKGFSYKEGFSNAVTLMDGSHVYASSWIKKQRKASVGIGGGGYKIGGSEYDPVALEYFKKLIKLYLDNGVEIGLIMTPYHPNVFKKGQTKPVVHFTVVEEVVKRLSQEYGIKYYGSYFPNKLDCKENEFFDFMHATQECLGRVDFSQ